MVGFDDTTAEGATLDNDAVFQHFVDDPQSTKTLCHSGNTVAFLDPQFFSTP